jgi:hypothetical protein
MTMAGCHQKDRLGIDKSKKVSEQTDDNLK